MTAQDYEACFVTVVNDQHALIQRCRRSPALDEHAAGLREAAMATLHRAERILTVERLCLVHQPGNHLVDGDELVNAMRKLHHLILQTT